MSFFFIRTMDTLEIMRALNAQIKNIYFLGVFACNKLPRFITKRPSCLIVNTDPSHKPGTHWVAIYIPYHGNCEYFDSFGFKPQNLFILNFLLRHTSSYKYNGTQLQSVLSDLCGNYCCEYLLHRSRGKTMSNFIQMFNTNDTLSNDTKLHKMYNQHFSKKKPRKNKSKHVLLIKYGSLKS